MLFTASNKAKRPRFKATINWQRIHHPPSFRGIDMKKNLLLLAIVSVAGVSTPAWADQALATAKNCMACHALDRKLVGPAYKDVAAKYAGDKYAVDKLASKIQKGGSGVWGPVPMPANTQVNDAEAKKLAAWVLTIK
jgi:cytochrome c